LAGFLPWIGLLPRMATAVRHDMQGEGFKPALLLAVWAGAIFVFFSLSSSKLPGYIMPVYPALAMLAARVLDKMDGAAWNRQLLGTLIVGGVALLASPLVGRLESHNTPNALFRSFAPWVVAACALAVAGLAVAHRLNRNGHRFESMVLLSLSLFTGVTIGVVGHETLGRAGAGIDLVAPMQSVLTPDMPIYSVRLLDHTLPFYLGRTMIMVEAPDELEFGARQEPGKWIPTLQEFLNQWSSGGHAVAIMSQDTYAMLRRDHVAMFPIAEDHRRVVVANFTRTPP
jgi:4-amino-4-deoxy-L-arabinose transferase-like glycosyltransferase